VTRTRNILAKRNAAVLSQIANENVLLAFDYDGTLAPIARTPEGARMRARTRTLLIRVAQAYPAVVISGRALADISRRVERIPFRAVFGNHGLEPVLRGSARLPAASQWLRMLRDDLPDDPGVRVEDKTHTLTIHYRLARDRRRAIEAIDRAVRKLPAARVVQGIESVNLLPRDGPNKGTALNRALRLSGCSSAVYLGDDRTDEDAFSIAAGRVLGVRIGAAGASRARYHLTSQQEVDRLLLALAALRRDAFA
jgi:trehalose 6-phosphate phosphatase